MNVNTVIKNIQQVTSLRCPRKIKIVNDKRKAEPWNVITTRETNHTIDIALHVPSGYSVADLQQETDSLYAIIGKPISIIDRAGVAIITIHKDDFPDTISYDPDHLKYTNGKTILCGFDISGNPVIHNFRVPHMLVGAQSGYGKTDFLRWVIFQLITSHTPEQLHIDIIDGKGFSFLPFRDIPHIRNIVRDLSGTHFILNEAREEMENRSNIIWNEESRDKKFKWRLIIIDELAMISPSLQTNKHNKNLSNIIYSDMVAISCIGREAGIGLILATQRPDISVLHPQVKQNCDVSIAFRCKTMSNSEIIIDRSGAEKLPVGKAGRGIYSGITDTIFQTPYIGKDDKWYDLLKPYRKAVKKIEETKRYVEIEDLSHFF